MISQEKEEPFILGKRLLFLCLGICGIQIVITSVPLLWHAIVFVTEHMLDIGNLTGYIALLMLVIVYFILIMMIINMLYMATFGKMTNDLEKRSAFVLLTASLVLALLCVIGFITYNIHNLPYSEDKTHSNDLYIEPNYIL